MSATVPTGDRGKRTLEQGSLYADVPNERLVRLSNPNRGPDGNRDLYRVEIFTAEGSEMEGWTDDEIRDFISQPEVEYLAGHCFDSYNPYGVWADDIGRHTCPNCGKFMTTGFYHADKYYPGLVCPDYEGAGAHCDGHLDLEEVILRGIYITAEKYIEERF